MKRKSARKEDRAENFAGAVAAAAAAVDVQEASLQQKSEARVTAAAVGPKAG